MHKGHCDTYSNITCSTAAAAVAAALAIEAVMVAAVSATSMPMVPWAVTDPSLGAHHPQPWPWLLGGLLWCSCCAMPHSGPSSCGLPHEGKKRSCKPVRSMGGPAVLCHKNGDWSHDQITKSGDIPCELGTSPVIFLWMILHVSVLEKA